MVGYLLVVDRGEQGGIYRKVMIRLSQASRENRDGFLTQVPGGCQIEISFFLTGGGGARKDIPPVPFWPRWLSG
jgi:hypothetical protein